jgi:hypothetical protein
MRSALGSRKAEWAVLPVQAQVAPTLRAGDQCGAQLVAQAERSHDFAVPRAGWTVAPGRVVQRSDVPRRAGQRGEPVDVLAAELVVQEQPRRGVERILGVCAGEQQRLRIGGRDEGGVDGHGSAEAAQHLLLHPADVEARVTVADQVALDLRRLILPATGRVSRRASVGGNPNFLGWSGLRSCRTLCR